MKPFWIAATNAALLTVSLWPQDPGTKPSTQASLSTESQLVGVEVVAELSHSLDAKKAKSGDLVKAVVTQDVVAQGRIVIRRGSKIVGHVTETKLRTRDDQESRLGVIFDRAIPKGEDAIKFHASIRALAAAIKFSSVDQPDLMPPPLVSPGNSSATPQPMGTSHRNVPNNSRVGATTAGQASSVGEIATASASPTAYNSNGVMGGGSRGVFGLPGLHLVADKGPEHASIITSNRQNVRLDSGTQILIQVNNLLR